MKVLGMGKGLVFLIFGLCVLSGSSGVWTNRVTPMVPKEAARVFGGTCCWHVQDLLCPDGCAPGDYYNCYTRNWSPYYRSCDTFSNKACGSCEKPDCYILQDPC